MLQLNFTPFPVLNTGRLQLRAVNINDANEIFFLRSDERVLQYLDRKPPKSLKDVDDFIERIQNDQQNNDSILWGICLKDTAPVIGTIGYWQIQKEHYRAETGYMLHPDYQGKGIMDEALKAVIKYGFETMQLHSIEANVNPANAASMKLLEKNGFVKEAYFRENYFYNGQFLDSVIYSLLNK